LRTLPCPEIGEKWFLFLFWDLGAVFGFAPFSDLFAISFLLEPAEVLEVAEWQGHDPHERI